MFEQIVARRDVLEQLLHECVFEQRTSKATVQDVQKAKEDTAALLQICEQNGVSDLQGVAYRLVKSNEHFLAELACAATWSAGQATNIAAI